MESEGGIAIYSKTIVTRKKLQTSHVAKSIKRNASYSWNSLTNDQTMNVTANWDLVGAASEFLDTSKEA